MSLLSVWSTMAWLLFSVTLGTNGGPIWASRCRITRYSRSSWSITKLLIRWFTGWCEFNITRPRASETFACVRDRSDGVRCFLTGRPCSSCWTTVRNARFIPARQRFSVCIVSTRHSIITRRCRVEKCTDRHEGLQSINLLTQTLTSEDSEVFLADLDECTRRKTRAALR